MVRWYIFLCIFRNFLCKRKQLWPLHKNALKLLNLFLLNNSLYGQNIAILTYDKVQDQAVCLLKATQKSDILVKELRILSNLEKCCCQNKFDENLHLYYSHFPFIHCKRVATVKKCLTTIDKNVGENTDFAI